MLHQLKTWVKAQQHPLAKWLYRTVKSLRHFEVPAIKIIYLPLYSLHQLLSNTLSNLTRIFYWTPLFKMRLANQPKHLFLYTGMSYISGPVNIHVGDYCRISGQTTFSGRYGQRQPELIIGDRVGIGWQTTIAVGSKVVLGNDVRIAGRAFLAGYPGHPIDPQARAKGLPDSDSQIGDIILEDNVWLATGVMVMANVRIGKNSIIAAGSIVTKDIPPNSIAAGMPAKVIKTITSDEHKQRETELATST